MPSLPDRAHSAASRRSARLGDVRRGPQRRLRASRGGATLAGVRGWRARGGRGAAAIVLGAAALAAAGSSGIASAALGPGYVRVSQGDVVAITGTDLLCAVELSSPNVAAPVAGIRCGRVTRSGARVGSYWVSLRVGDRVAAAQIASAKQSRVAFSAPASQPPVYAGGYDRTLPLPLPQLIDVADTGLWCYASVAKSYVPGQRSIFCYI